MTQHRISVNSFLLPADIVMKHQMPAVSPRGQMEIHCPKAPAPCPSGQDRWALLDLVVALKSELGLNDRDITVLRAHLSVLPKGPLHPTRLLMSFMSVSELQARASGMEARRLNRAEAKLEEAGLIARKLSANGRRFPVRSGSGDIVDAYGIDLTPLLFKIRGFENRLREIEERNASLRAWRTALSSRMSEIVRRARDLPANLLARLQALREAYRNAARRKSAGEEVFRSIERDLCDIEAIISLAPPCPARAKVELAEVIPESVVSSADQNSAVLPSDLTGDDRQTVRHIESSPKESQEERDAEASAQKAFVAAWLTCEHVVEFHPVPPASPRSAQDILSKFGGFLGLGQKIMSEVITQLGYTGTVIMLNYITEKISKLDNPTAYVHSMLRNHESGNPIAAGRIRPLRLV